MSLIILRRGLKRDAHFCHFDSHAHIHCEMVIPFHGDLIKVHIKLTPIIGKLY